MNEVKITPNGIKQAIDDLLNENELLQEENKKLNNIINKKEQFLGDNIKRLEREVVKRDNIINELEKYINENYIYDEVGMKIFDASELQDKLQELKGSDKE